MDPLQHAIETMEANALAGGVTDTGHGWRHAALICRLSWGPTRALRQLRQHARFHADKPLKAAAYREAAALLEPLTGEPAAPAAPALPPMPVQTSLFALP